MSYATDTYVLKTGTGRMVAAAQEHFLQYPSELHPGDEATIVLTLPRDVTIADVSEIVATINDGRTIVALQAVEPAIVVAPQADAVLGAPAVSPVSWETQPPTRVASLPEPVQPIAESPQPVVLPDTGHQTQERASDTQPSPTSPVGSPVAGSSDHAPQPSTAPAPPPVIQPSAPTESTDTASTPSVGVAPSQSRPAQRSAPQQSADDQWNVEVSGGTLVEDAAASTSEPAQHPQPEQAATPPSTPVPAMSSVEPQRVQPPKRRRSWLSRLCPWGAEEPSATSPVTNEQEPPPFAAPTLGGPSPVPPPSAPTMSTIWPPRHHAPAPTPSQPAEDASSPFNTQP